MRIAIVTAEGLVENVIEAAPDYMPEPDRTAVPAEAGAAPGWTWDGAAFLPPSPDMTTPESVSDLQFRLALNALGLRDAAEAVVEQGSQGLQDYWERSLRIHRDHPFVSEAAQALGKSAQEIDGLFRLAAGL